MSKILEALKARTRELPPAGPAEKEVLIDPSARELTQQQLADIYFSSTGRSKTAEPPVIIRVIERPRAGSLIPWTLAAVAFLITALSLFSTKRIFVDVHVIDDKSPLLVDRDQRPREKPWQRTLAAHPSDKSGPETAIPLQDFQFEGAAVLKSSKSSDSLELINSSVAPFARASLDLSQPTDMTNGKVVFYARGARGGENLAFAMKDIDNMQAFHKGKIYPFPAGLTTSWQKAEIPLEELAPGFDPKEVTHLRFEFGSRETENRPGDSVYVKDLRWIRPAKA